MKIVLDIETKGDKKLLDIFADGIKAPKTYKDPEKIANYIKWKKSEAINRMALDSDYLEIVVIGIKELGKAPRIVKLKELEDILPQCDQLITYNGKSFDIPAIIKAGIKAGLNLPYKRLVDMTARYKRDDHIDLFEVINKYGEYKSLDKLLQIYCGISKVDIDFASCSMKELKAHCLEDVINTEKLYDRFKMLVV